MKPIYQQCSGPSETSRKLFQIEDPKEFEYQCALWALGFGWEEIVPKVYPTPPKEIKEIPQSMMASIKAAPGKYPNFWENPRIIEYYSAVGVVRSENEMNLNWLMELKRIFNDNEDFESKSLVNNRIYDFLQGGGGHG